MSGIIKGLGGWLKNSFIDFPGTVSTVLFFNRCNLACPYCHNPDFTTANQSIEDLSDEIWEFLKKRKVVIGGVVLSGGEPTLFKSIISVSKKIKSMGFKIKLDTNGLNPGMIKEINPDYLALDVKAGVIGYNKHLGASVNNIGENLAQSIRFVKAMGNKAEVRITAAPQIVNERSIIEISEMIEGVKKVYLQKLSYGTHILDLGFFDEMKENISLEKLEEYRNIILKKCECCEIR